MHTLNEYEILSVKSELERRQELLIALAHDPTNEIDNVDRGNIIEHFEKGNPPARPREIQYLTKIFYASAFSYAPLRRYLQSLIGIVPSYEYVAEAIAIAFEEPAFTDHSNWTPQTILRLAEAIQSSEQYDLTSRQFKPRMISVFLTGSVKLNTELNNGLDGFYGKTEAIFKNGPEAMWKFVKAFSKPISNVGAALMCDFLKNIGFTRFVKIDHHMKKEFPRLLNIESCRKMSELESFKLSQIVADKIGLTPFHLDHLLYQWGRYKNFIR